MRHNTFIDPKMNTLNNLPYLPTEIWDKIFDIKYSLDDKESMKKHNDYHKPLLDEFKKECIIVDELRHDNLYGYDNTTFIHEFFHYLADVYFIIEDKKKISSDYYFNHEDEFMSDDSDDDHEYWSEEDADYDLL